MIQHPMKEKKKLMFRQNRRTKVESNCDLLSIRKNELEVKYIIKYSVLLSEKIVIQTAKVLFNSRFE